MLTRDCRGSVYKEGKCASSGEDLHAAPSYGGRQKGTRAHKAEEVLSPWPVVSALLPL